jgi:hypothetical protein
VRVYDFAEINRAAADSSSGEVVKPVLRCRHEMVPQGIESESKIHLAAIAR